MAPPGLLRFAAYCFGLAGMNQEERRMRFFVVASAIWPDRIVRPPSANTFRVWARIGASPLLFDGTDELLRQAVATAKGLGDE